MTESSPLLDDELVDLFAVEPELLAIADAIARAALVEDRNAVVPNRRRMIKIRSLIAISAVAAATVVALVAPWDRTHGTLADRALAAIGSQPVIHAVVETPTDETTVNIASGATQSVTQRDEVWFDAESGKLRDVTTEGQTVVSDVLETSDGTISSQGIVYDCSWIAAHPVAATKAGVSCSPTGDNGTVPRDVPEPRPALDPGLADFIDGYRQALESGQAQSAGSGEFDGRRVDWLTFQSGDGAAETVGLDATSHAPVVLKIGNLSKTIDSLDTVAYSESLFDRPQMSHQRVPSATNEVDTSDVQANAEALEAADQDALWAGPQIDGLTLVRAEVQTLTASFSDGSGPQTGRGLELFYGSIGPSGGGDRSRPYVEIQEAPSPALLTVAGLVGDDAPPQEGMLYVRSLSGQGTLSTQVGVTKIGGVYLTIQSNAAPNGALLAVARTLTAP